MRNTGRVFCLMCLVAVGLLLLSYVPTISINGMQSRPVEMLGDLFKNRADGNEDHIDNQIESEHSSIAGETSKENGVTPPITDVTPYSVEAESAYSSNGVVMIEDFSGGRSGGMNRFYQKLSSEKVDNAPIRIAYFGDSFIEGDILTCDLREMLQEEYGGSGPGWVDCGGGMNSNRPTVSLKYQNITEYVTTKKPFNNRLQCINQRYYYAGNGATLHLGGTKFRPHAGKWNKATLFFSSDTIFSIDVNPEKKGYQQSVVVPDSGVQVLQTSMEMGDIAYKFHSVYNKTRLYGVALDGVGGVSLDNFSMRGTPGFTLSKIPVSTLQSVHKYRPYDLIVLHFGLNVVNDSTTDAICRHYVDRMKRVVDNMRNAFPEASIVVFSVSDRVQRGAGGMHTIKGVEKMVKYQRTLASECGVAYLNLFQAMGGSGSMKRFVDQGLAAKDYTHINYSGGKTLAGHIFNSIKAGVDNYQRRTGKDISTYD